MPCSPASAASHTGRFLPGTIDYFELADIFRFAIRNDRRRLFPPEGDVSYPGIGMVARQDKGRWFVSDVYDGLPADRAGILVGDEIAAVDGKPYREIGSFEGKVGQTVDDQPPPPSGRRRRRMSRFRSSS